MTSYNLNNENNSIKDYILNHKMSIINIIPLFSMDKLETTVNSNNEALFPINGFNLKIIKENHYSFSDSDNDLSYMGKVNLNSNLTIKTRIYNEDNFIIEDFKSLFKEPFYSENFKTLLDIKDDIDSDSKSEMNFSFLILLNNKSTSVNYNIYCHDFTIKIKTTGSILNSLKIIDYHNKFKTIDIHINKKCSLIDIFSTTLKLYLTDLEFPIKDNMSSVDLYNFISINNKDIINLKKIINHF